MRRYFHNKYKNMNNLFEIVIDGYNKDMNKLMGIVIDGYRLDKHCCSY